MNNIKEWLKDHQLITANSIEKLLNIPTGTIRINDKRAIPEKYIKQIESILVDYGYNSNVKLLDKIIIEPVKELDKPITPKENKPNGKYKFQNGHFVKVE
jgi:hypothetical protein